MAKRQSVWLVFWALAGISVIGYLFCTSKNEEQYSITMAGSAAMETFSMGLSEVLESFDIQAEPQFIGSSAGIEALLKGKTQIAMVSRTLTEEEKQQGAVENVVAYDGIIVIVNKENPVSNLSKEQLSNIFSGKIRNWREVGGKDEAIVTIGRELGSGTRDSFEDLLGITGKSQYCNECDSIGVVKIKTELLAGAISYVSLEAVQTEDTTGNAKVKVLSLDQTEPDVKTISNGEYTLIRPFILATKGEVKEQKMEVKQVFEVLERKEGVLVFERARVSPAKSREEK